MLYSGLEKMAENTLIDLRSDTVTQPSQSMREAMLNAIVGDDVYGEDPSVNQLEKYCANWLDKEAAMLVSSGTMGNLICFLVHCQRGEELVLGNMAHAFLYERGGSATVGNIHSYAVPNAANGSLPIEEIRAAIRDDDIHCPRSALLCLENTQAQCGGQPLALDYLISVRKLCDEFGLALHCDGARLWNAAIACKQAPKILAAPFDSLSVCLSKGLAAPVGSIVLGSEAFIQKARRLRKLLGGGMRQAGFIAAAAQVALNEMYSRLQEDHDNAALLTKGLQNAGYHITHEVKTNLVFFKPHPQDTLNISQRLALWKNKGLLLSAFEDGSIRAVTHYGINQADIERSLLILQQL